MCQVLGVSRSGYYDWTNRKPSARIVKREGLKKLGIRSITKKKYKATTHSKHQLPVSTNLLNQQFKVSQPGSVWSTDITYVYTKEGWFYLATVMDLFSRRIIGWAMAPRMTKTLVISALNKAYTIQEPREGLVHHSDQGSQYASI
ncbi:TPA: IS3 family transposase [Staphylococcus pseudintermedius]|nr:IS3 family transposase [Staphylococcus pseudintermedius]